MEDLTQFVRAAAGDLGFVDAGIAPVKPSVHYERYTRWLNAGYAAGMDYLSTDRALEGRRDPRALHPNAKAIISLMARYPVRRRVQSEKNEILEHVSTYAWGRDYHLVLREKLEKLVFQLKVYLQRDVSAFIAVDGAPLMEREIAASAGLGWIGKNSCLISPKHGSFTFLAELLIDLPLPTKSGSVEDHCGKCSRCIQACPTSCILPDRTIDARRCLSFQTIENHHEIPIEIRQKLSGWVFGCDICQMVCPWNQNVGDETIDPGFLPSAEWQNVTLADELCLTRADFGLRFKESPIRRTKWQGYLRNIVLALGQGGHPSALEKLQALANGEMDPALETAVHWALGQISSD